MSLIKEAYGCKVGWLTYDDEAEATAASVKAKLDARRKAGQGYDFGYSSPGEVRPLDHPEHGKCWVVTIP